MLNPALQVKEDPKLPDFYEMEIYFHDRTSEKHKIIGHGTVDGILSILTTENLYHLIPVNAIRKIEMNRDYSVIKQLHDQKVHELKEVK